MRRGREHLQNNMRNAIRLPKEKMKMKFKDAIKKLYITTTTTDIIQVSNILEYSKRDGYQYQVEILYNDMQKTLYNIGSVNELNFFIDTIAKLAYNCQYQFESIVDVSNLIREIVNCLWWDDNDTVESTYKKILSFTGLNLHRV